MKEDGRSQRMMEAMGWVGGRRSWVGWVVGGHGLGGW